VHLRSLIARIDRLTAESSWDAPQVIARGAQLLQRRGVVVVISDFYDNEEETRREMRRVAQRGHDVGMIQLMSPQEMSLPFTDHVELEDLESGARRLVDASGVAAGYRHAVVAFLSRWRTSALRDGIDHALITTDTPPEAALREYLLKRSARGMPRAAATAR
jgi:hypothetical protein